MPRFLYPEGHVLDPNDEADRLFEGHYIKNVSFLFLCGFKLTSTFLNMLIGTAPSVHRAQFRRKEGRRS